MNEQDSSKPKKKKRPRRPIRTERPAAPPPSPEPKVNEDRQTVEQSDLLLRWAIPGTKVAEPVMMPKLNAEQIAEILRKRDEFGAQNGEDQPVEIELLHVGYIDRQALECLSTPNEPDTVAEERGTKVDLYPESCVADPSAMTAVYVLPHEVRDTASVVEGKAENDRISIPLRMWMAAAGIDVDQFLADLESEEQTGLSYTALRENYEQSKNQAHYLEREIKSLKRKNAELLRKVERPSWWTRTMVRLEDWFVPKRGLSLDEALLRDEVWVINTTEESPVGRLSDVLFVYEASDRERLFHLKTTWLPHCVPNVDRLAVFSSDNFQRAIASKAMTIVSPSYARKLLADKAKVAAEVKRLEDFEAKIRTVGAPRTIAESKVEIVNPYDLMYPDEKGD